jgi:hypothetical protein
METGTDLGGPALAEVDPEHVSPADATVRLGEERQILLFGFGLGMTIGLIFLLYVVLGTAHLL